ncbi:MAG TPA: thioredoxin family protein [Pyrinomonadaceae bacterium]|nr:thioredoxin family protein [Pyrinomonadaceae bacterium]
MKLNRLFISCFLAALSFLSVLGQSSTPEIGSIVENFSLPDTDGVVRSLDSLSGPKGTVVIWLSAQCPVVRGYKDRINQLAEVYKAKGINFVGINSNATEDLNWVKSNITEFGYKFPVLIDKGNVLADKWGATVTPEVYFLDASRKLIYHGAIDNDRSGRNVTEKYLESAFEASLGNKPVTRTRANAFGCTIKRAAKTQGTN